jgi:hypothetical protein
MANWKETDPFEVVLVESAPDEFPRLARRDITTAPLAPALPVAQTAQLYGFDHDDRPLIVGVAGLPHEILPARTTVRLSRSQVGQGVVVVHESGDARLPIIIGILQDGPAASAPAQPETGVAIHADDCRFIVSAEREIVLRCGESSITLTRAGKVLIKGTYVVSRSSGYNRIKGAAVDIN